MQIKYRFMNARIFASGFRPAFLLVGLAAVILVPAWLAVWAFGASLGTHWPPTLWHAHEMIFGFVGAAIAGFLLTAVPSWTGEKGCAGWSLAAWVALWLSGRLLIATGDHWPATMVLAADVGFLVVLAALVAAPLLRSRNRNSPLLIVLLLLAACNAAFHCSLIRHDPAAASHVLMIALDVILLMVTVIGGRIIPAFTNSGLRASGSATMTRSWPMTAQAAIGAMLAAGLIDALRPDSTASGAVAGAAALV